MFGNLFKTIPIMKQQNQSSAKDKKPGVNPTKSKGNTSTANMDNNMKNTGNKMQKETSRSSTGSKH